MNRGRGTSGVLSKNSSMKSLTPISLGPLTAQLGGLKVSRTREQVPGACRTVYCVHPPEYRVPTQTGWVWLRSNTASFIWCCLSVQGVGLPTAAWASFSGSEEN